MKTWLTSLLLLLGLCGPLVGCAKSDNPPEQPAPETKPAEDEKPAELDPNQARKCPGCGDLVQDQKVEECPACEAELPKKK